MIDKQIFTIYQIPLGNLLHTICAFQKFHHCQTASDLTRSAMENRSWRIALNSTVSGHSTQIRRFCSSVRG